MDFDSGLKIYINWLEEKGINFERVDCSFEKIYGIVLKAKEFIPDKSNIIQIPNNLIIEKEKIKSSSLGKIIKENPEFFYNEEESKDYEYKILAFYLMSERNLGKKSIYYPFLNYYATWKSISDWSNEDIDNIHSTNLKKKIFEYQWRMEVIMNELCLLLEKYKTIFPDSKEKYKIDFCWSYQLALNKGIKCDVSILICPFVEFVQYFKYSNVKFKLMQKEKIEMDESSSSSKQKDLKIVRLSKSLKYIHEQKKHLTESQKSLLFSQGSNLSDEKIQDIILDINLKRISKEKADIYNLEFFELNNEEQDDEEEENKNEITSKELENNFQIKEEESYFCLISQKDLEKGEILTFSYKDLTNEDLLLEKGIAVNNNINDYLSFKLYTNSQPNLIFKHPDLLICNEYSGEDDMNETNLDMQTKEFFLEKNALCEDLILQLRSFLYLTYEGTDSSQLSIKMPSSINFEIFIFEFALKLLIEINNKVEAGVYENDMIMKQEENNQKKYFSALMNKSLKEIIEQEIKNVKVILFILRNITSGLTLRESILKKNYEYESEQKNWMINRIKIKSYLKKLFLGIFYQNK